MERSGEEGNKVTWVADIRAWCCFPCLADCLQPSLSLGLCITVTFMDYGLNGTVWPSDATIAYVQDSLKAWVSGGEHEDVYRNELAVARSSGADLCNPIPYRPKRGVNHFPGSASNWITRDICEDSKRNVPDCH